MKNIFLELNLNLNQLSNVEILIDIMKTRAYTPIGIALESENVSEEEYATFEKFSQHLDKIFSEIDKFLEVAIEVATMKEINDSLILPINS